MSMQSRWYHDTALSQSFFWNERNTFYVRFVLWKCLILNQWYSIKIENHPPQIPQQKIRHEAKKITYYNKLINLLKTKNLLIAVIS